MMRRKLLTMTGTSPASASTATVATIRGLSAYDFLNIDAFLIGATGGTLDVYLQREITTGIWTDWARFTQLASGAAAIYYSFSTTSNNTITSVGKWDAASPPAGTQVLTAGSCIGGHPGDALRLVAVAGSSTSAGAALTIYLSCFTAYT